MTPKEKAKELLVKYLNYVSCWTEISKPKERPMAQYEGLGMKYGRAKQCALIAVDEILVIMNEEYLSGAEKIEYWQEVKKELLN